MKALITGGAGFIGSNLAEHLTANGHSVTVFDNFVSGWRDNLAACPQARVIEGDIRDGVAVRDAAAGADVIFHLAAAVGNKRSIDDPVLDVEVNALGTVQVLCAARDLSIKKVVLSSSAGIFGELRTLPIREDHRVDPDSPYGASKLCAEKEALVFGKLFQMEVVCLRYFNVYGPKQRFDAYGNVIPIFAFQMLRGDRLTVFGDGEQTRDFVSVHDVVSANVGAALTPGVSGAYNIGSGSRISINALISMLQAVSGLTAKVCYGPPRAGDVRDSLADISAASQTFGYAPTVGFREGLSEYVSWAREAIQAGAV